MWYCHENLKPLGPLSLEDIKLKVQKGEVGPYDLLQKENGDWKEASSYSEFSSFLFPAWQEWDRAAGDPDPQEKKWVLLVRLDSKETVQEGPLSTLEVLELLKTKSAKYLSAWIWKNGLSGWAKIGDRPEFREIILLYL